jgi:dTDP-4-amino-4,6-dideoxygalactose transaminase
LNQLRGERVRRYDEAFAAEEWLETPTIEPWAESSHHNYAVKLEARDDLARHLKEREVMTSVHYLPLHHHPFYRALEPDVPRTESVWQRLLLLPLHAELSAADQDRVIDAVLAFAR